MNILEVTKKPVSLKDYKKRSALEPDATTFITEDTLVTENGKPIILYKKLTELDTSAIRWAVRTIKYRKNKRTSGLVTQSRIFGYSPRIPMRQDYCSSTLLSKEQPKQHFIVANFAKDLAKYYAEFFPDIFEQHQELVMDKVKKDWIIPESPFTSGIVNKNNPLKYHFDAGNFKDVFSNMIVFKKDVEGGHLACPEYNLMFAVEDNSVVIFDGQKILHGVTPIIKKSPDAYRYSVVYYSLQGMWKCQVITDEIARIREVKKQREWRRMQK